MKFLNIKGQNIYLIGVSVEDDIIVLETPILGFLVRGIKDGEKLIEKVADVLSKKAVTKVTLTDNSKLKGTILEPVINLNEYGKISIEAVPRYEGTQHVVTNFGLYEVNSLDFNAEEKELRINIAGEYNDIRLMPQRGTTYKQLEEFMLAEFENNRVVMLKSEEPVITREKLKFKVDYI